MLLAQEQREKFITTLQLVFNRYNLQIDAKEYFKKTYFHKMRDSVHVDEVKNIFL